jgi:competence protein ComFA
VLKPVKPCSFCHNNDPRFFAFKGQHLYCRRCLEFNVPPILYSSTHHQTRDARLVLHYSLTSEQQTLSKRIIDHYQSRTDVMVDAVTGSGKTEIVFGCMHHVLSTGGKVGFVIPRRDVVRELTPRIQQAFPSVKTIEVYGGHHDDLMADITVLTTHQIYRYDQYFDLLVFDEVDAFPYHNNRLLEFMVKRSKKGIIVYLSATFTHKQMVDFSNHHGVVEHLYVRHHGHRLPSLTIIKTWKWLCYVHLIFKLRTWIKQQKPVLIFVPTIAIGEALSMIGWFIKGGAWVHAQSKNRDGRVDAFKQGALKYLISTSILERGITLKNLQVMIVESDHVLMEEKTIVQMAGRVGRKKEVPYGDVILYCQTYTNAIQSSQTRIRFANGHVLGMHESV